MPLCNMEEKMPLVSFCLFTYNQEQFIRDALEGAVSQDYENMEIIVSDDSSTDKTFDIINDFFMNYHGNHRIIINRNEKNLGIAENVNKVLYTIAKGEFLVLAAGDDVSLPNRTSVGVNFMLEHKEVSSVSFASKLVDKKLNPLQENPIKTLNVGNNTILTMEDYTLNCFSFLLFSGDSRMLRRIVVDSFPPLKYVKAEDIYLFVRSLYVGSIAYIRQSLVLYRQHDNSVMNKARNRSIDDIEKAIEAFEKGGCSNQLIADMEYAIENGYISEGHKIFVLKKINWIVNALKPKLPRKEHSKLYNKTKEIARRIAKLLFRE